MYQMLSHPYDSNLPMFMNGASWQEQQSLPPFMTITHVYCTPSGLIVPFQQKPVGCGNDDSRNVGVNTTKDKDVPISRDIRGFKCDVCGSLFTSSYALEGHCRHHPHMESDRRHLCHLCSYSTDKTSHLRKHLLTHSGERPHQCPQCHKEFTVKNSLQRHLLTHTGERPFSCSACGKAFNQLIHLNRHERTHSGERLYRCPTCGKDFTRSGHLKRHELMHTQEKSYRCKHCDYRSADAFTLRSHVVFKHTRDFRHTCTFCGKGFNSPSEVKKHIDRQHSNNGVINKKPSGVPEVEEP